MPSIKRRWLITFPLVALVLLISGFELWHRWSTGHFVSYGIHSHVMKQSADIGIPGIQSMYAFDVFNYRFITITVRGCKEGTDVSPYYEIIYRYQVEKWDSNVRAWTKIISLNSTDCPADQIVSRVLWPGQSVRIVEWEATAAREGFQSGDSARFVAYALFDSTDTGPRQMAFISRTFPIQEHPTNSSVQYRVTH